MKNKAFKRNMKFYHLTSPLLGLVGSFAAYSWLKPPPRTTDFSPYEPVEWWVPISTGLSASLLVTFLHKVPSSTSTLVYVHVLSGIGAFAVAALVMNAVQKSRQSVRDANLLEMWKRGQTNHKGIINNHIPLQQFTREAEQKPLTTAQDKKRDYSIAYLGLGVAIVGGLVVIASL